MRSKPCGMSSLGVFKSNAMSPSVSTRVRVRSACVERCGTPTGVFLTSLASVFCGLGLLMRCSLGLCSSLGDILTFQSHRTSMAIKTSRPECGETESYGTALMSSHQMLQHRIDQLDMSGWGSRHAVWGREANGQRLKTWTSAPQNVNACTIWVRQCVGRCILSRARHARSSWAMPVGGSKST